MMGKSYDAGGGCLAFAYCPPGEEEIFYTVLQRRDRKGRPRRLSRRLLPKRQTIEEAQADLDYYAWLKGWKPAY